MTNDLEKKVENNLKKLLTKRTAYDILSELLLKQSQQRNRNAKPARK